MSAVVAIFVGGKSSRMGRDKGLLVPGPGPETIVERLVKSARGIDATAVLVGDAKPYAELVSDVARLDDAPAGVGPIGGLCAALDFARGRTVITVACDMPHVSAEVLSSLLAQAPGAGVLACKRQPEGPWEAMLARFDSARTVDLVTAAVASGVRSFQALFAALDVTQMPLTDALSRALQDWDRPQDVTDGAC